MSPLLVCLVAVGATGTVVDRVIAVVDKEVITHSELVREARVALVRRQGEQVASGKLAPELLDTFLDYLVNQVAIDALARRLGGVEVPKEDVAAAQEAFARRFRGQAAFKAFLRRFDISDAALANILRRDLRNDRYIEQRMRSWRVRTGEPSAAGDSAEYQRALKRWLTELRAGVELRVLGPNGNLELQEAEGRR